MSFANEKANHAIECHVSQCNNHCGCEDYCTLDKVCIGTHECGPRNCRYQQAPKRTTRFGAYFKIPRIICRITQSCSSVASFSNKSILFRVFSIRASIPHKISCCFSLIIPIVISCRLYYDM